MQPSIETSRYTVLAFASGDIRNARADREGTPIARSSTVHQAADHERSAPRSRPTIGRPCRGRHRPRLHRSPRIGLDQNVAVDLDRADSS